MHHSRRHLNQSELSADFHRDYFSNNKYKNTQENKTLHMVKILFYSVGAVSSGRCSHFYNKQHGFSFSFEKTTS